MSTREPVPPLSLLFAGGPVLLILALGIAGWVLPPAPARFAVAAGWLWGTAILLFLAGVTRGLSFFSPGGPHRAQIVMMLWIFLLGFGALATPTWIGFALLILGYGSIAAYDPAAARAGLAPGYFARLRVPQMGVAIAGLVLMMLRALHG